MAGRKKHQEESFENAEGFQIEDLEGNVVVEDEVIEEDATTSPVLADEALLDGHARFWEDDEDDDETEEDEYFNSVAENNDWEEGYDY